MSWVPFIAVVIIRLCLYRTDMGIVQILVNHAEYVGDKRRRAEYFLTTENLLEDLESREMFGWRFLREETTSTWTRMKKGQGAFFFLILRGEAHPTSRCYCVVYGAEWKRTTAYVASCPQSWYTPLSGSSSFTLLRLKILATRDRSVDELRPKWHDRIHVLVNISFLWSVCHWCCPLILEHVCTPWMQSHPHVTSALHTFMFFRSAELSA